LVDAFISLFPFAAVTLKTSGEARGYERDREPNHPRNRNAPREIRRSNLSENENLKMLRYVNPRREFKRENLSKNVMADNNDIIEKDTPCKRKKYWQPTPRNSIPK